MEGERGDEDEDVLEVSDEEAAGVEFVNMIMHIVDKNRISAKETSVLAHRAHKAKGQGPIHRNAKSPDSPKNQRHFDKVLGRMEDPTLFSLSAPGNVACMQVQAYAQWEWIQVRQALCIVTHAL